MIMGEPLEIQSSSKPDFSDPMFFQDLFRECLENEVHDNTQWMTIVSLCAQTLFGEIMQQKLKLKKGFTKEDVEQIESLREYSLQVEFRKGNISDEKIIETKTRISEILEILED